MDGRENVANAHKTPYIAISDGAAIYERHMYPVSTLIPDNKHMNESGTQD